MGIKTRIEKLEQLKSIGADKVYFVDIADNGNYIVTVEGQEKEYTKQEFERLIEVECGSNSVFFFNEKRLED